MDFGSKQNSVITKSRWSLSATFCPPFPLRLCTAAFNTSPSSPVAVNTSNHNSSPKVLNPCKNSNGNGNAWAEALNASSPPPSHSRLLRVDPLLDTTDSHYHFWISRHPSALLCFEAIIKAAHGKRVAVFLDYDGTLSPIVDNPDCAFMSDMMRSTVREVAQCFPVAIISGRCRDKVYDFVQIPQLYYAGSHGMDIMGPAHYSNAVLPPSGTKSLDVKGNKIVLFQPAGEIPTLIEKVCRELEEKIKWIDGVRIENNKFCASVHFRCVNQKDWNALAEYVVEVVKLYPNLSLTHGRKVLEIRPTIVWNKGKALEFLINALGLGSCDDVFPVYIGDDRTDEDAFKVVKEMGQGLGILVSNAAKDTAAMHSLRDPSEVMEFLRHLVNWKSEGH